MKRNICVIANGYAEEIMASKLMSEIRKELQTQNKLESFQFVGGSLVSSGRWYEEEQFATFFTGGMTPSGGFPTRSLRGFLSDLGAGAFFTPFRFKNVIKGWSKYNLDIIIVVGDFLLMTLTIPALKNNKNVPMVFIPTAKSDYIQAHFKIEKKFIKKYATISFPRDKITTDDFLEYGINAQSCGNLMQDLLDPKAPTITSKEPVIALLPGSREESYGNLEMMLSLLPDIKTPIHWAFVQAGSLKKETINEVFLHKDWKCADLNADVPIWGKNAQKVYCYPSTMFDTVALSCIFGISLAGTAGEQIAGLGKPIIGFKGTGPQSTKRRMDDNAKLLGESFIYVENYPTEVITEIKKLINNSQERDRLGAIGISHMGNSGATTSIAQYIVNNLLSK